MHVDFLVRASCKVSEIAPKANAADSPLGVLQSISIQMDRNCIFFKNKIRSRIKKTSAIYMTKKMRENKGFYFLF